MPESVKTVPQFLDWAKRNPEKAAFGSPAAGSVPHFVGVLLAKSAGMDLRHIPYRGTQPAILDLMGGQLAAVSGPVGDFLRTWQELSAACLQPPEPFATSSSLQ